MSAAVPEPVLDRETLIAAAAEIHDGRCGRCDRKYRMSCPDMANAILEAGKRLREAAAAPEPERDLSNAQLVGRNGYGEISLAIPRIRMTRDEALVHAAWLVILAGGELEIGAIIAAIGGAS